MQLVTSFRSSRTRAALAAALVLLAFMAPPGGTAAAADTRELSLQRAIFLAQLRNPAVAKAKADRDIAVLASRQASSLADFIDPGSAADPNERYQLAIVKFAAPITSKNMAFIAERTLEGTKDALRVQVTRAYYACYLAEESAKVAEEGLSFARESLRVTKLLWDEGLASREDVLRAERDAAEAEAQAAAARQAREGAWCGLLSAIGIDLDARPDLTTPLKYSPVVIPDLEEATEKALRERPEVYIARRLADNEEIEEDVAAEWALTSYEEMASLETRKARAEEARAEDMVRIQVRQALASLEAARERLDSRVKARTAAGEALRIASLKLGEGLLSPLEAAAASLAARQAELGYLQAVYDHECAVADLECITGRGFYQSPAQASM